MTDLELLQKIIDESGVPPTVLAAAMGVSMPTYYDRKNGVSEFKASEIRAISRALQLTNEQRDSIFFKD